MTQNFENLFDLCKFLKNYASILGNLTELSNGKASKQQKLLEQIRQSTNQNQTADEAFEAISQQKDFSKNFSDLVDDTTETLLEKLQESIFSLTEHIPKAQIEKLPENLQQELNAQKALKMLWTAEFLLEERLFQLVEKLFKQIKALVQENKIAYLYGKVCDLEMRLASFKIVHTPHLINYKQLKSVLRDFFETGIYFYQKKPQIDLVRTEEHYFKQIKQEFERIGDKEYETLQQKRKDLLNLLQKEAYEEDIYRSFKEFVNSRLKQVQEETEYEYWKNSSQDGFFGFSFYNLLLIFLQINEKARLRIKAIEDLIDIYKEKYDSFTANPVGHLFSLTLLIRHFFDTLKKADFEESQRILELIRKEKRFFQYNEDLLYTSFGYFLENLIFGLEHRQISEQCKANPDWSEADILDYRAKQISENLKIFSQRHISNLLWRFELNNILLNFRLCIYQNNEENQKKCLDSIEQLCLQPNFDKRYPNYWVDLKLMASILHYQQKEFTQVEKNAKKEIDNFQRRTSYELKPFQEALRNILRKNENTLSKAYQKGKDKLAQTTPEGLLEQAMLWFFEEGLNVAKRTQKITQFAEPVLVVEEKQNPILTKIEHYRKSILLYCQYLALQDWENWKLLFADSVHLYIKLYDHSPDHIIKNLQNFFKDRKNIHYSAQIEHLQVKVYGDLAIVPLVFGWQHNGQEPYQAEVETSFYFNDQGKIRVVQENKILNSKGVF
ncbi:hypothetical protein [Raineya sp.]|jgi:hypothetical protein